MNQEHDTQSQTESEASVQLNFGAELRRAREKSGQSIEDVASALFVRPNLISALEVEDLSVFSAPVYAIGLLRSYARLLDIPLGPLLAALEAMGSGHEPQLTSVSKVTRPAVAGRGSLVASLTGVAAVLVIAMGVIFYQGGMGSGPNIPESAIEDVGNESGDGLADRGLNLAPDVPDATLPDAGIGEGANIALDAIGDGAQMPAQKEESEEEASPAEDPAKLEVSLLLIFDTDSWAEVHDAAGRRLLTRVGRAGQKLSLLGEPPFDVRLGYAPGVRIEYNGQPYVWEQNKRSRVAHLKVGAAANP